MLTYISVIQLIICQYSSPLSLFLVGTQLTTQFKLLSSLRNNVKLNIFIFRMLRHVHSAPQVVGKNRNSFDYPVSKGRHFLLDSISICWRTGNKYIASKVRGSNPESNEFYKGFSILLYLLLLVE